jgi:hypothetical protein
MKTLNTLTLNKALNDGLRIIEKFSKIHTNPSKDYFDLLDYLQEMAFNYYYDLIASDDYINADDDNKVKLIKNCFWHAINVIKLQHGTINNTSCVDDSVDSVIDNSSDSHEYARIVKSKYVTDYNNYIDYEKIALYRTDKTTRQASRNGIVKVDYEYNTNNLLSGYNADDRLNKIYEYKALKNKLSPMFSDNYADRFYNILKSEKALNSTDRNIKARFIKKYAYLKTLDKNEIVYIFDMYKYSDIENVLSA